MQMEQITISVPAEAAQIYRSVSPNEQRKLEALMSLRLLDAGRPPESLKQVMREVSRAAQERGLTPEILQTLLDDNP